MADTLDTRPHATTRAVPSLSLEEYMSPRLFPLTTRDGLTPREQFQIDAADLDHLSEYLATGVTPTEEQWLRLAELEEKAAARAALAAELEAAG
jgi:hypothetical protein